MGNAGVQEDSLRTLLDLPGQTGVWPTSSPNLFTSFSPKVLGDSRFPKVDALRPGKNAEVSLESPGPELTG